MTGYYIRYRWKNAPAKWKSACRGADLDRANWTIMAVLKKDRRLIEEVEVVYRVKPRDAKNAIRLEFSWKHGIDPRPVLAQLSEN